MMRGLWLTARRQLTSLKSHRRVSHRRTIHWSRPIAEKKVLEGVRPIADPEHPSLFYHVFEGEAGQSVFAVTLTEQRPTELRSQSVVGWLPATGETGLDEFVENKKFLDRLHEAVRTGVEDDEVWVNAARQIQSGWMHIYDQRKPPPLGRAPEPEDIIGMVLVDDGEIVAGSYLPMPSYRLVTTDGVVSVTPSILNKLL